MPEIRHIFLDDGGVMNDNSLRSPQWEQLVGEFFVPRLGGTMEAWAAANIAVAEATNDHLWARLNAGESYGAIYPDYEAEWLTSMCREVGVKAPTGPACAELSHEASMYVTRRVRSAYSGAIEAIKSLGQHFELFTASNEHSTELEGYLGGMGVIELFHGFYGPDLIDATKHQDTYYARMFAHAGVDPAASLVVDDKIEFLHRARAVGAHVVRIGTGDQAVEGVPVIASLAALPALLENGLLLE